MRVEQQWHREAREVEGLFRTLGSRVSVLPEGHRIPEPSSNNILLMWWAMHHQPWHWTGIQEPVESMKVLFRQARL